MVSKTRRRTVVIKMLLYKRKEGPPLPSKNRLKKHGYPWSWESQKTSSKRDLRQGNRNTWNIIYNLSRPPTPFIFRFSVGLMIKKRKFAGSSRMSVDFKSRESQIRRINYFYIMGKDFSENVEPNPQQTNHPNWRPGNHPQQSWNLQRYLFRPEGNSQTPSSQRARRPPWTSTFPEHSRPRQQITITTRIRRPWRHLCEIHHGKRNNPRSLD